MHWVVLGDECVLAPASAAFGSPVVARPRAAAAIARLNQSGYAVVLASHYARPSVDANAAEPRTPALQHAFWHALAEAGAQVSAVFFWPDDGNDADAAAALLREISTRYDLDPHQLIALFTRAGQLEAARRLGCQVFAVAEDIDAAEEPPAEEPSAEIATAADLTHCVEQIIARQASMEAQAAPQATEPPTAQAA